jgi:hypothetical protein
MTRPLSKWELEHLSRMDAYARQVERLYRSLIDEVARSVAQSSVTSKDTPFSFDDYPLARIKVDILLSTLANNVQVLIGSGTGSAWNLSNSKNDELVSNVFADAGISESRLSPFNQRNLDGLVSFQARSVNGLTLSNRVWTYSQQFRGELELGIDTALLEGTSASKLATRLKKYLNRPDDLFRRVRTNRGNLVLSKHAAAFHPGQGVYKSSYRNAERLARTEINTAYRTADFERYQQLPFVVGIRVQRSNNTKSSCDVCPSLVGIYPANYKFAGFHANCRCFTTTILATKEELSQLTRSLMAGNGVGSFQSRNEVKGVPANYTDWIEKNRERLSRAKSLPQFITDNPVYSGGL